jgi:hemerythrin-like domain-containing protein
MLNNSKPNVGAIMVFLHRAITRGMDMTIDRSAAFAQKGFPDAAAREGFETYVRTLASVINAHHIGEDDVVFPYLKSKLPEAPYDILSANHREMDVLLNEIQLTVEAMADQAQTVDSLNSLNRVVTRLAEIWHPHIGKEQIYLYDVEKTETLMNPDEHIKLISETSQHSMQQGDPAFLVPFILYNLQPDERANLSQVMPPVMIQELIPGVWKQKWEPMRPFMLG